MRAINWIAPLSLSAVMLLAGCMQIPMHAPQPSVENLAKLRRADPPPGKVEIGRFSLDPSQPEGMDRSVSVRGSTVTSPVKDSMAQYLGEALRVELQSAGLLDPQANTIISGTLLDSTLNGPIGTGNASLTARFVVKRSEAVQYDRTLHVDSTWDSPFVGAIAIPEAARQYEGLYRKLIGMLLDDESFIKSLAAR
ncbi:hypothetical protein CBA19CS22_35610 [Caballeronia novacaledonica]|jgi:hypothetical protein|uniref:Uncharacterized protein n=1 Tax=Caballeronia novacaledonica TaxID=1544861 RepID=A0ACB5R496_9BURK|nr:hypothetical protein [Caballeronia sp. EK]MBC8636779.1 hypothetical protein [Caballeronia sp. EK]GJH21986.1 hypothetical protein CBA19CS22_35610 [Caballeronia novacaledonica]